MSLTSQLIKWIKSQRGILKKWRRDCRRKRFNAFTIKVFRELNSTVCFGPFKGMKYIQKSNSSALLPKILGTYEKELHKMIEQIIDEEYQNIIDIGCAEGYYAVGFAYRSGHKPDFHIYAYDTNEKALQNLVMLSMLNSVTDKITSAKHFDYADFELFTGKKTLIFCDIEGGELSLLDPSKAPSLLSYDLLVEIHDGGDASDIIKSQLTHSFQQTHLIQLIKFTSRSLKDAVAINFSRNVNFKAMAVNEGRKLGLEWMWLKRFV
jgi:hypothetical protein